LRVVNLAGTEFAPDASGIIVISQDGEHGTLVVDDLPDLGPEQQYQLWLIQDGERTSGGVFSVKQGGYAAKVIYAPHPLVDYGSFGVTIEPTGGSPGPTGEKVLGGNL
jgi:anti-sigma-K factor RskA